MIFEGDSAIFVEVSSSRLNVKKTLIDLDAKSVAADIKKIVVDNAEQLDKSIKPISAGRHRCPAPRRCRRTLS